ncbi:MarR family transcriptional regulator [Cryobacterium algoritolerans]|uniref:MarR family transcriptional regulator n=1 Tax=Cryobacterium algoritolerans TaxID=1259184 RepID=A0A4R8WNR5_9MICO|nr:MarR family winged helix-turn-helix transcriptional regulator [Cryobacterium algoritolerans]TFC13160.1 MarR family transcriptional regulator [Cryobacterium algoritolerans]
MPTDLHTILGDLVSVNHRLTRVAAHAANNPESPAVWRTLSVLLQSGSIRLGALASRSRVSQPTATKLVSHLELRGWATRLADPLDARVSQTAITPAGEAALLDWRSELAAALLPMFADLPADDVATLERAISILRDRVERSDPSDPSGLVVPFGAAS